MWKRTLMMIVKETTKINNAKRPERGEENTRNAANHGPIAMYVISLICLLLHLSPFSCFRYKTPFKDVATLSKFSYT